MSIASYIPYSEIKSGGYDLSSEVMIKFSLMCKKVEELLEEIKLSFVDIEKPSITFHVARAYDNDYIVSKERGEKLNALDTEVSWEEVSKNKVETYQEYFYFSDSEGWRFYLPAFMKYYLLEFPNCRYTAIYDVLVDGDCDRLDMLDVVQRSCVEKFVELCNEYVVAGEYL